jgi:hypothetical protein
MSDNEKTAALIAAFLFLWFWQKGHGDVTLTFPPACAPQGFVGPLPPGEQYCA